LKTLHRFIRWGSQSLLRHILLFEALLSLPCLLFFSLTNYSAGTLTVEWEFRLILLTALTGAGMAVAIWILVILPNTEIRVRDGRRVREPKTG
jgi:hypothetical protein